MSKLIEELDLACPGFTSDEDRSLDYTWMTGFVRHVIRAKLDGRDNEVRAVFAVIERTVADHRPGQRRSDEGNLAIVGFLEDLQNGNLHREGTRPGDFVGYLGPRSLELWNGLNGFWQAVEHHKR